MRHSFCCSHMIWKLCGAKQFRVCILVLHDAVRMPCIHRPGPNSFLHVTLVLRQRILISALEAPRPFGHHDVRVHSKTSFDLQSSSSQAPQITKRTVFRFNLF